VHAFHVTRVPRTVVREFADAELRPSP